MKQTYLLTNLLTGDEYVGVTGCRGGLKQRLIHHKSLAKKGRHNHLPLYENINKYGWENFIARVLCEGDDEEYVCWLLRPSLNQCWVGKKPVSQVQVEAARAARHVAVRDTKTGKVYESMKAARLDTGCSESSISRSIRQGAKYRWEKV